MLASMQELGASGASCILRVRLTVRRDHSREFHDFEARAARIMARYGGVIEVVSTNGAVAGEESCFEEVHAVSFPDEAAFEAYRSDAELGALAGQRAQAIVKTQIERVADVRSALERDAP
jgi:uncharacterized protein (DUF1330 family)